MAHLDFNPCNTLLPETVVHYAETQPDKIYAHYRMSAKGDNEGYRKITYRSLANAIDGAARWLYEELGPGEGEILAYIGPNDARYPILTLGAVKAGYCMFFPSPRNSRKTNCNLLGQLKCTILLTPTPRPPSVTAILDIKPLTVLEVLPVEDLLELPHHPFEYNKAFETAAKEPLFVIHSSGSTGDPKPVTWTHEAGAAMMQATSLNPPAGFDSLGRMIKNKKIFTMFPPFHGAGLGCYLFWAIPFGIELIAPTSGVIPSAVGMVEALKLTGADAAFVSPSIIEELSLDKELLESFSKDITLLYAGGALPESVGNAITSEGIRLFNQYGATELGLLPMLVPNRDPKDWGYMKFHPSVGAEFRPVDNDNPEHELVIVRKKDPDQASCQAIFALPGFNQEEYRTRDLFVRHLGTHEPHLWRWCARTDDIITLLNGEKFSPIPMEHFISRNHQVTGVLVVGNQRFQAALLIEADTDDTGRKDLSPSERARLFNIIWPTINEANKDCPAHARIAESHVLFTRPGKPMIRTGKGTVQRRATLDLYVDEINALYENSESLPLPPSGHAGPGAARDMDRETLFESVKSAVLTFSGWSDLNSEKNIFELGMDSLQTVFIAKSLREHWEIRDILPKLIYEYPTISELTDKIMELSKPALATAKVNNEKSLLERKKILEKFQKQIDRISEASRSSPAGKHDKHTVILTGSTGSLGTYLLHDLLADQSIKHVYCLNRRKDSRLVQIESNQIRQLDTNLEKSRVTFLTADLSKEQLNLPDETYEALRDTATVIVHNAWPVNFNIPTSLFEAQLQGLVNLLALCTGGEILSRLFFISSKSSIMTYPSESGCIPEQVVVNSSPAPNGYAESKYLAEQLLHYASTKLSIPLAFARLGQIAGAVKTTGLWNPAEWFPSLVLSSLHLGCIPDSLGPFMSRIDWVPVDLLSEVLVELALERGFAGEGTVEVFHPVNLYPRTWDSLLQDVQSSLSKLSEKSLKRVPLEEWVQSVRQDLKSRYNDKHDDGKDLRGLMKVNPAAKLLDFYEDLNTLGNPQIPGGCNVLDSAHTPANSARLHNVSAVSRGWVDKWVSEFVQSNQSHDLVTCNEHAP